MGLLEIVTKKEEKKSLGVCIPEHRKQKLDETVLKNTSNKVSKNNPTKELLKTKNGTFRINGSYRVMDTIMLSGIVEEGTIRKRMKAHKDGRKMSVTEVRKGNGLVETLSEGEEGTLFISAKLPPLIGFEDRLSFKG